MDPILRALMADELSAESALAPLGRAAREAPTSAQRGEAQRTLGALAGRALGASWDVAERAAFVLLDLARDADAPAERARLLDAMGRGFRNVWLMPYVHSRLSDDDGAVVARAIAAAGGLAFPALEAVIAQDFLGDEVPDVLRLAAIAALGRMGAESAAPRLVPFVGKRADEACAALAALTEIRSRAGEEAAIELLARDPPRRVLALAMRYLAELGQPAVLPALRDAARDEDAELRLAAGLASRALKAERARDPGERILVALTERDRAVRAALARRLRTLPVGEVLDQAKLLLSDDPEGVIQIVAEVRSPEVTRMLLEVARDASSPSRVRARAAGSIEADEPWERDAMCALVREVDDVDVRVSAIQTLGAFAPVSLVVSELAPVAFAAGPRVRAALLWALQLTTRPHRLTGADRASAEAIVARALGDEDPVVRRRAAYVAGNLDADALVPRLVELARAEKDRPELRVAAYVALGDLGASGRFADLVHLWNREDDPDALGAASRALERSMATSGKDAAPPSAPTSAPPSLARVHDRLPKLLGAADARVRAAAARVCGLAIGAVPVDRLAALVDDDAPRVRAHAVAALGRAKSAAHEGVLAHALDDADPAIQERAAEALLAIGTDTAVTRVLDFVSRTTDREAAVRVAAHLEPRPGASDAVMAALAQAIARLPEDDPAVELLLDTKLAALEAARPTPSSRASIESSIAAAFPTWPRLSAVRGFEPLARSLRTAETLHVASVGGADADPSAAIVLWMKCMEGYMHAWLSPRLRALQERPAALWDLTDELVGASWTTYQRYLAERWADPVTVGGLVVEVPLRSAVNALRELQERRLKSLDSPQSVTEWSRLMLFFAVDHPSGPKNVLRIACKDADRAVRTLHRLQVLAQVRNAVTHRAVADRATVTEFRRLYYAAFEDLVAMA